MLVFSLLFIAERVSLSRRIMFKFLRTTTSGVLGSPRRRHSKEWSLRRFFLASLAEVTQRERSCSDMSALATNCLESEIVYNGGLAGKE